MMVMGATHVPEMTGYDAAVNAAGCCGLRSDAAMQKLLNHI